MTIMFLDLMFVFAYLLFLMMIISPSNFTRFWDLYPQ